MSRPTSMKVDGVVYWTLMTYDDSGVLIDADSTPVIDIRKNGAAILDVATSSKRSGRTGIYDYAYNPAGEAEGDTFLFEETATISGQAYVNSWSLEVDALASASPTVADIVDGVWDENPTLHTTSGTFGKAFNDMPASTADSVWDESATLHSASGSFGELINDSPSSADVADAVWDETAASHNTAGTFGYELNNSVAPPTVGDIADAVWDEATSSHSTVGTFGRQVTIENTPPTASDVADAVWDENASQHAALGSFGKLISDSPTTVDIAGAVWEENAALHVSAGTFGGEINSIPTPPAVGDIADAVWDEATSGHGLAGSFGNQVATGNTPPTADAIADAVWDESASSHTGAGSFGELANESPSSADIADAVWDENAVLHVTAGTFGGEINSIPVPPTVSDIADGVWDEATSGHAATGSFGRQVAFENTPPTVDAIADAVWDEQAAFHTNPASFGGVINESPSSADIADAVWEESAALHVTAGTFGKTLNDAGTGGGGGGDATLANQTQLLADIAALNDFDPANDAVANVTLVATTTTNSDMRGTDDALPAASAPSNWSTLIVGTGADAGKVTTSNPAAGSGSSHTAQDVANLILVTPANKLATDASGDVSANNMRGTDGANTVVPNTVAPDNAGIAANNAAIVALNDLSASDVENAVWDATVSSHVVADSYGLRSLVALNSNRTLQITGSNHTAADVHEFQANSLTSAATDASFVTEMQSGLASQASVDVLDTNLDTLVANQGDWATADVSGLLTASVYNASLPANFSTLIIGTGVDAGKVTTSNPAAGSGSSHTAQDVANLILAVPSVPIGNTATGSIALVDTTTDVTNQSGGGTNPADIYAYFTSGTNEDVFKADVSGLSTFDHTVDQVTASNMRGTDGANTVVPVDVSADVTAILADTGELQANQGQWITATGFNTVAPDNASISAILADTADLQANQGQWLTATGFSTFDPATDSVITDAASRNASKADVSGLSTFDSTADQVVASNMRGTDSAILATSAPTNWPLMIVDGTGKVTTSNPAAGGGSAHTAADVRDLILAGDKTPITMASNKVSNVVLVDTTTDLTNGSSDAASIYAYFTSGSNEDVFKADVSLLALESSVQANGIIALNNGTAIAGLNDFDPTLDTVARVTLVDTTTDLTNGSSDAASIYSYFTSGSNEDAFKADTSGLATSSSIASLNDFDPTLDTVARVTLVDTTTDLTNGGGGSGDCPTAQEIVDTWGNQPQGVYTTSGTFGFYLDSQVSTAGSGGAGLYQATVRVQDTSDNALQGARVNVDGTTLTLTTDSSGEVTFNLDSGVYLLEVSPPANYDTPIGQVLTITSGDPSDTEFTLNQTTDPTGCTPPWIG